MELCCGTSIFLCLTLIVVFVTHRLWYWKRKNVPKSYKYFKKQGVKFYGIVIYILPCFVVTDLELIKHIVSKDFQHFTDHGVYHDESVEPLGGHLFNLLGEKWKKMRTKLTSTFTSGKMKMMFSTIVACSKQMMDFINSEYRNKSIDIKEVLACFTTDVIGSCAFGLNCNSFQKGDNFRKYGKKVFQPSFKLTLKRLLATSMPNVAKLLRARVLIEKDVEDFFVGSLRETLNYREKNNYRRNDFLQLLIDLKNDNSGENDSKTMSLTFFELAAQAFVFFLAGFETSSTTMTFCLYELALNPHIQDKVRQDIEEVLKKHNNEITYEALMEMKYLNQTIEETLRKHPPLSRLLRTCRANYTVPNTNVVIEKGTKVLIPVYQIHHDEEYYPNPEEFNPDRFNEENKPNQYAFLPFGEGPRMCIGSDKYRKLNMHYYDTILQRSPE